MVLEWSAKGPMVRRSELLVNCVVKSTSKRLPSRVGHRTIKARYHPSMKIEILMKCLRNTLRSDSQTVFNEVLDFNPTDKVSPTLF